MWSVWYVVSRGSGGGIGYRETTRAPVLPAVTQRTFEMNYFIANCALPSLCGLHSTGWQHQPDIAVQTESPDWLRLRHQHTTPTWYQQSCWVVLSPSWIPCIAFSVCRSRSINCLHSTLQPNPEMNYWLCRRQSGAMGLIRSPPIADSQLAVCYIWVWLQFS